MHALLDAADPINIAFDPPDPNLTCRKDLETCRQSGVEPASWERALGLIAEWNETIAASLSVPPTTH